MARTAGVSLATVDRVLNGRRGVRPETAEKVEEAIRILDFRRDLSASLLARARDLRVVFLLPDGDNEFMAHLGAAIARRARTARPERLHLETAHYRRLDSRALAERIGALEPATCDCAVVVATEDDAVRTAIDAAGRRGIAVMTLVSDLTGSSRRLFIGIDNAAAGRTAASLMGRFCPAGGKVGIIAGSLALRDHRERLEGFRAVAAREYAGLEIVGPLEGSDDDAETESRARDLFRDHPDLRGLYNVGAGNAGLLAAMDGAPPGLRVIAHELTDSTRLGLASGRIDVVLDQNPAGEIRTVVGAARTLALGSAELHPEPIEIGIFLRDNLR